MRLRLGLKWKIFTMLAVLGLCTQSFDLWHSARLIAQATSNTEGGVKALWPVFGIGNQMLAAIAFCLATTIILKSQLLDKNGSTAGQAEPRRRRRPALALVTFIPLTWLLAVTMTAGVQKIFHPDKTIGFLAAAAALEKAYPDLEVKWNAARASGDPGQIEAAKRAVAANRIQHFNSIVDTAVTAIFLSLVGMIVVLSVWEWIRLLTLRKPAQLRESPPIWLPEPAITSGGPSLNWVRRAALLLTLAKEMSGEATLDRAERAGQGDCPSRACPNPPAAAEAGAGARKPLSTGPKGEFYAKMLEQKYSTFNRCC